MSVLMHVDYNWRVARVHCQCEHTRVASESSSDPQSISPWMLLDDFHLAPASPVPSEWKASTQGSNRAETTEGSREGCNWHCAILWFWNLPSHYKLIWVVHMYSTISTTIIALMNIVNYLVKISVPCNRLENNLVKLSRLEYSDNWQYDFHAFAWKMQSKTTEVEVTFH